MLSEKSHRSPDNNSRQQSDKEEVTGKSSRNIEWKTGNGGKFELYHPHRPKNMKVRLPMTYTTTICFRYSGNNHQKQSDK